MVMSLDSHRTAMPWLGNHYSDHVSLLYEHNYCSIMAIWRWRQLMACPDPHRTALSQLGNLFSDHISLLYWQNDCSLWQVEWISANDLYALTLTGIWTERLHNLIYNWNKEDHTFYNVNNLVLYLKLISLPCLNCLSNLNICAKS